MGTRYQGSKSERDALDAFIKLMRCSDAVAARLAVETRAHDLTPSQFGVLEALLHLGPLHQNELGRKLLKSSGNITVVIDHLEASGLVRRQRDKQDRRYITVSLTPAGRRLISRVFPLHVQAIVSEMGGLNQAELRQLSRLCRKLGRQADGQDG